MSGCFHKKNFFYCALLTFKVLLDISYIIFINPVFEYVGFVLDGDIFSKILSWMIVLFCMALTPHVMRGVSDYFAVSFFLAILVPLSVLVGLGGFDLYPYLVTGSVYVILCVLRRGSVASALMPIPRLPVLRQGRSIAIALSSSGVASLLLWYIFSGGLALLNFDLTKVYEYREANAEIVAGGFMAYFNNWVYCVLSVFLMSWSLYKDKYFLFLVLLLCQVVFFGVSAHKSVLFFPVLIFSVWYYFKRTNSLIVLPLCFSAVIIICLSLHLVFDDIFVSSMFVRRVFFVPALLTFKYFEFFSLNDYVYWSNSILSGVGEYPYELPLGLLIGEYVGEGGYANNGFVASGYAHAGLVGVYIYTIIFAYILKFLDVVMVKSGVPIWLGLGISVVPLRAALISSDLFTTLLTHGLLISLFLLLLFRRASSKREYRSGKVYV